MSGHAWKRCPPDFIDRDLCGHAAEQEEASGSRFQASAKRPVACLDASCGSGSTLLPKVAITCSGTLPGAVSRANLAFFC